VVAAHALAYPPGSTSQAILDTLIDSESDELSMSAIEQALPHIDPNTVESATRWLTQRGRLLKVSPGIYKLSPMLAAVPAPDPVPDAEDAARTASEEQAERDRESALQRDRERKRLERERARSAALAKQAESDAALRSKLLEACGTNYAPELPMPTWLRSGRRWRWAFRSSALYRRPGGDASNLASSWPGETSCSSARRASFSGALMSPRSCLQRTSPLQP
jgi:hypothetical protein